MTPFETAIITMLGSLVAGVLPILAIILKDRVDDNRDKNRRTDFDLRAGEVKAALEKRATELQQAVENTARNLAADLAKNTTLTQHAAEQATAAYHEANNVNLKIKEATKLGNRQADERDRRSDG